MQAVERCFLGERIHANRIVHWDYCAWTRATVSVKMNLEKKNDPWVWYWIKALWRFLKFLSFMKTWIRHCSPSKPQCHCLKAPWCLNFLAIFIFTSRCGNWTCTNSVHLGVLALQKVRSNFIILCIHLYKEEFCSVWTQQDNESSLNWLKADTASFIQSILLFFEE